MHVPNNMHSLLMRLLLSERLYASTFLIVNTTIEVITSLPVMVLEVFMVMAEPYALSRTWNH